MDTLFAAIHAAARWSQSAQIGPIANSNFYILLFIPIGIIVLAYQLAPRTKWRLWLMMAVISVTLLPSAAFVFCVGIALLPGVSVQ